MTRIDLFKIDVLDNGRRIDVDIESVADTGYIDGYDEISRYIVNHNLTFNDFKEGKQNKQPLYRIVDNGFMYLLEDVQDIIKDAYEKE